MLAEQIQISENQQNKTKQNKPHRIESTNEPIEKETTIFQDKFQALILCVSDHSAAKKRFTIDRKCRKKTLPFLLSKWIDNQKHFLYV